MVESEREAQTAEGAKRELARDKGLDEAKKIKKLERGRMEKLAFRYLIRRVYEEAQVHESSSTNAPDQAPSRATSEGYEAAVGEAIEELFKDFDERLSNVNRRLDRVLATRG